MKVAISIKKLSTTKIGESDIIKERDSQLYRLYPPFKSWDKTHNYVVVSGAYVYGQPETYIFASNKKGEISNWTELEGSIMGSINHKEALGNIGYRIIPKGKLNKLLYG